MLSLEPVDSPKINSLAPAVTTPKSFTFICPLETCAPVVRAALVIPTLFGAEPVNAAVKVTLCVGFPLTKSVVLLGLPTEPEKPTSYAFTALAKLDAVVLRSTPIRYALEPLG